MVEFIVFIGVLIVGALIKNAGNRRADKSNPSPRVQRLIERMQAQQSGTQPTQLQGRYTQPAGQGNTFRGAQGQVSPGSQGQASGSGSRNGYAPPGQYQPAAGQFPAPAQYQPGQSPPPPIVWQPPARVPNNRPPQNNLPTPKGEFEQRIRELVSSGNEVAAVRLLCDEQDMGIIEAQKYARSLLAPPGRPKTQNTEERPESARRSEPAEEETRYVGSAAFAESVFTTDADENVWASGWVDKPEADDRTDMDELWQTVRNAGRPPQPNN